MNMLAMAAVLLQSVEARAADGLTIYSLTFMLIAMGSVTLLAVWCFIRILGGKAHFDPDGTGPARPPVTGSADPPD